MNKSLTCQVLLLKKETETRKVLTKHVPSILSFLLSFPIAEKENTSKLMVAQFLLSESNQLYQVKVVEQIK